MIDPGLTPRFEATAARAQAEQRLPGLTCAVFERGEVSWQTAIGLASVDPPRPAGIDTSYRIGSITKTFTAALVLRIYGEGRLDLDRPASELLPELGGRVTIRQLLSHRSGLQREFVGRVWETLRPPSRDELIATLDQVTQVLDPGLAFHYSNLAYALLGEMVARVSGRSYRDLLETTLLEPLGMVTTSWSPGSGAATGYAVEPYWDGVRTEPNVDLQGAGPAGQLWSTAGDLARWGDFLAAPPPSLLTPAAAELMHAPQVMADPASWTMGYGLGLALFRRGDRIFAGHGGAMPGFRAGLVVHRQTRIGAVALANSGDHAEMEALALDLAEAAVAAAEARPVAWQPGAPPGPEILPLLGRWWSEGEAYDFHFRDGRLMALREAAVAGQPPAVFEPAGPDRFRVVDGRERGELLEVVRDPTGEPVKLYWATYACTRRPLAFADHAGTRPDPRLGWKA